MSKEQQLWQKITKILKTKIPENDFNTWFSNAALSSYQDNKVNIQVPNKFISIWLHEKYLTEIKASFKLILKETPEIHFLYPPILDPINPVESQYFIAQQGFKKPLLNPSMTFDRFLTDSGNHFAFSTAKEVTQHIKDQTNQYNPFYIYSASGLGKTHLLNAIGWEINHNYPDLKVNYFSADSFKQSFGFYLKNKVQLPEFRAEIYKSDLLLLDDIHLLANQKRLQGEFLSLFNSLFGAKKQIIVTGDRPPSALRELDVKIKSRLGWGLLNEIKAPEQKLKIKIIKNQAKQKNLVLPEDVIFYLAHTHDNLKGLIKHVDKLETFFSLKNEPINISNIKFLTGDSSRKGFDDIKRIISNYYNISIKDINSNSKKRIYSYPRQISMYLTRKYLNLSFNKIGFLFGDKDHSTVVYAIQKIEKMKTDNKKIREDLKKLSSLLN
ncbi:MAG: chromosomal replication initiator protein DnaA [Desulfobacteraceae bacterium]|nr:MAG: chromosomal replication initiator protein DnaA [Desulfobacteraceae bacterium]